MQKNKEKGYKFFSFKSGGEIPKYQGGQDVKRKDTYIGG